MNTLPYKIIGILCFVSLQVFAGLDFTTNRVELGQPKAGESTLRAEFPFLNSGSGSVRILETISTCGCTIPEVFEKNYLPGAKGVVKVRFEIGDRQGQQTKQVTVRTDAGDYLLTLAADLPKRLTVTPRLHIFRNGETERVLKVELRADTPVRSIKLGSSPNYYQSEVAEVQAGTDYEIRMKLTESAPEQIRDTIQLHTIGASGKEYVDTFYLRRMP